MGHVGEPQEAKVQVRAFDATEQTGEDLEVSRVEPPVVDLVASAEAPTSPRLRGEVHLHGESAGGIRGPPFRLADHRVPALSTQVPSGLAGHPVVVDVDPRLGIGERVQHGRAIGVEAGRRGRVRRTVIEAEIQERERAHRQPRGA